MSAPKTFTKKKILAVDDDILVRKSLELFLKEAGYEPTIASGGGEALNFFAEKQFDLIITDIRMPEMDGIEMLRAIREYCEETKKPPIPEIVLTAYNDEHVKESVRRLGIKELILKPFRLDAFLKTLEKVLRAHS